MGLQSRQCERSEVEHVRKFVAYVKRRINDARYYPPVEGYRYIVALALYSKCITVAEAILVLLDAGFNDEAFGMTRTLVDVYFTLRYIANQDTDGRARRFSEFAFKDATVWNDVITTYWPQKAQPLDSRTTRIASTYPHPHHWSGKTVKEMALEPDMLDVDPATGKPFVHAFAYQVIYRWTSHYVHPAIGALQNHLVKAGQDPFTVNSRKNKRDMRHFTLFNVAAYVANTMISFYRCWGDPQPDRVSRWGEALIKHIARRHK
jgi:hypothetical protein